LQDHKILKITWDATMMSLNGHWQKIADNWFQ